MVDPTDPAAGGGAGGAGGTPASAPAGGAPAAAPWLEGARPETTAWISEQGFKTVDDLAASQRGLLKMRGVPEKELLRLSDKWEENPEAAAAVYTRLGRPEKPDEYEIPDFPVGDGDMNLAPEFKKWAHDAGLSRSQASKVATQYQSAAKAYAEQRAAELETRIAQEEIALKAEWGGEYDANLKAGAKAYQAVQKAIGFEESDLAAMERTLGHAKTMKLMAMIGRTTGEHAAERGDVGDESTFGMTPAFASKRADELLHEAMKLDRYDPERTAKLEESNRYRHIATGEAVPEYLRQPGRRT